MNVPHVTVLSLIKILRDYFSYILFRQNTLVLGIFCQPSVIYLQITAPLRSATWRFMYGLTVTKTLLLFSVLTILTYSFITVKTERSTLQYNLSRRTATIYMASAYAATQDSNQ